MKICGTGVPDIRPICDDFAKCVSKNVRCRPSILQKGCNDFTTPAPCVHRLAAPAANVTTATSPRRSASIPRSILAEPALGPRTSLTSSALTSSITVLAGRRFCAKPILPDRRSPLIWAWTSTSKPFSARRFSKDSASLRSSRSRGSRASKSSCTTPRRSGCVRHATANLSSSARSSGRRDCGSRRRRNGARSR